MAVVDDLEQEHQLLGAGADDYAIGMRLDLVFAPMKLADRLPQTRQPFDRQIVLFRRVQAQRLDQRTRNRKGRSTPTLVVDMHALPAEFATNVLDGQCR